MRLLSGFLVLVLLPFDSRNSLCILPCRRMFGIIPGLPKLDDISISFFPVGALENVSMHCQMSQKRQKSLFSMTKINVHCNHLFLSISHHCCGSGNNCHGSCRVILTLSHLIPGPVSAMWSDWSLQDLNPIILWHFKTVPGIPSAVV